MLKYFYKLYYEYSPEAGYMNQFDIGYFVTPKDARKAILQRKDKPGFKEHGVDGFKIQKVGVRFKNFTDKQSVKFYELSCEKESKDEPYYYEDTFFGLFETYEEALAEQQRNQNKTAFRDAEFTIEECQAGMKLCWIEGFVGYDSDNLE